MNNSAVNQVKFDRQDFMEWSRSLHIIIIYILKSIYLNFLQYQKS